MLDDLKIKFAAEQKKVTDLRRQVSVLLIGLSPHCQYEAYFFCFYSTASEGEKSRTLRKNWTVCDSRLAKVEVSEYIAEISDSSGSDDNSDGEGEEARPPTNLSTTVLDYLFELARGKFTFYTGI